MTAPTVDWTLAACARHDPELWFPSERAGDLPINAKRICHTCPIRDDCREYALADASLSGIWGELSPLERKRIRAERNDPAPGDEVCLCGCDQVEHRRVFGSGRSRRGACISCTCDEYVGVVGG